ncbi:MAG: 4-(cytidine 5'-diphospho)-2-C-methyl-D-erythritol kinase [Chloroflexota bacterium]|nr:4-(cytidine 5'-diphospho)-2-C-methyl-D-erythritol kinase [Chloroflexota bacterium]
MDRRVRVLAPAKVNLTLDVLGRRPDGYHELASVMATVDLRDDVRVATARDLEVAIRPDVGAPRGEDLATRAVRALASAAGRAAAAHVVVRKRIPVAGGLGGGSSDAGAVLRALAALWGCEGLDLVALGATIGSDVPFFAAGAPLARVGGRGEVVAPLRPPADPPWIVLVTLPVRSSTREVFAALTEGERGDGAATRELARLLSEGTASPRAMRELARNDLTSAAERVSPAVRDARAAARQRGLDLVVSGSGPSLFAVADGRAHALRLARSLRRCGLHASPRALCISAPVVRH